MPPLPTRALGHALLLINESAVIPTPLRLTTPSYATDIAAPSTPSSPLPPEPATLTSVPDLRSGRGPGTGAQLVHAERGAHAGPALRGRVHQHPRCPPIHARDTCRASVQNFRAFSPRFTNYVVVELGTSARLRTCGACAQNTPKALQRRAPAGICLVHSLRRKV